MFQVDELVYSTFSLQEGEPKLDKKKSSPLMVTDIVSYEFTR